MYKHKLNKSLDIFSSVVAKLIELDGKSGIEISSHNDIMNYGILTDCNPTKLSAKQESLGESAHCQLPTFNFYMLV